MNETACGNPILVEVIRGSLVESRHAGAIAVADATGRLLLALGDVERPIYPRSAVKVMQALPLIESGAADAFALGEDELAVACASHGGDGIHVETVQSLLAKAGLDECYLACGAHWPVSEDATRELVHSRQRPRAIHNNCSGKHAGMLATAMHLGLDPRGYERPDHPVQIMIARIISEACGIALDRSRMGIDGCSVPTFALSLAALAGGFARLGSGERLPPERASAARRLFHACFAEPAHVAGEGRFDTIVLRALAPSCFTKGGAEGVHCAALPALGLGIALKVDDGAKRGAELAMSEVIAALLLEAKQSLAGQLNGEMLNWRGIAVGRVAPSEALQRATNELAKPGRPLVRDVGRDDEVAIPRTRRGEI
jgi:L-asparaginase II